jgi:hypothetical protein
MTEIWRFYLNRGIENNPPRITSIPPTNASVYSRLQYRVTAIDPDGDALSYSLVTTISGMTIDISTGLLMWTPPPGSGGNITVTVKVSDSRGGNDTQTFTLFVYESIIIGPKCTIISPAANAIVRGSLNITGISLRGTAAVIGVHYRIDGGDWIKANGTNYWNGTFDSRSLTNGKHRVEAQAYDGTFGSDIVSVDFTVSNPEPAVSMENNQFSLILVLICLVFGSAIFLWYRKRYP